MRQPSYHIPLLGQKPWREYARLLRLHRPIGSLLLLWPTLMALWGAAKGRPSFHLIVVFTLGVFVMRSAGCAINDWADRDVDGLVARTKERPLARKTMLAKDALILFAGLIVVAFFLVCMTNILTIQWSIGALLLAATYPFMKRFTHYPQVVLGAAFAWGIPMAYAAQANIVSMEAGLLFSAMFTWTIAYDTAYAMADKEDDLKAGIKSTAIAFGNADKIMVAFFQMLAMVLFAIWGFSSGLGEFYALGLFIAVLLSIYQLWLIRHRDRALCLKAFLNNQWVGLALFVGMLLDYSVFFKTIN